MSTRVYVGRITREVRERDLEKFFGTIGEIRSVTIKNGFAFVEFRDYRDAEDAVHDLNNKEFFGERIVCELARGERRRMNARDKYGPMQRTQYRCIVENLAPTVSWQDLKDFMRKAGEVTYADCHKEHEGEGVVEFSSSSDLREALRRLDDQDLKGRRVTLREDTSLRDRLDRDGGRSGSDRGDHHERDRGDRRDHRESRRRSPSPRGARGGSPGRRSRSPVRRRSRSPRRTNGGDRRRSPSPRRRGGSPDREMPRRRGDSPGPDMDVMRDRPQED